MGQQNQGNQRSKKMAKSAEEFFCVFKNKKPCKHGEVFATCTMTHVFCKQVKARIPLWHMHLERICSIGEALLKNTENISKTKGNCLVEQNHFWSQNLDATSIEAPLASILLWAQILGIASLNREISGFGTSEPLAETGYSVRVFTGNRQLEWPRWLA